MFERLAQKYKKGFMSHVSKAVLVRFKTKKPITWEEYGNMRMNSYERRLVHPLLDTPALIKLIEHELEQEGNTPLPRYSVPRSYTDSILRLHLPELLKRIKEENA